MYFVEEVGLVDDVCVLAWVRETGFVNWLFSIFYSTGNDRSLLEIRVNEICLSCEDFT